MPSDANECMQMKGSKNKAKGLHSLLQQLILYNQDIVLNSF